MAEDKYKIKVTYKSSHDRVIFEATSISPVIPRAGEKVQNGADHYTVKEVEHIVNKTGTTLTHEIIVRLIA